MPLAKAFRFYRRVFYPILMFWSGGLLAFTIIRLVYTVTPRDEPSLFDGKSFYDPSVVELCFCGMLTLIFSLGMLIVLAMRAPRAIISRNWFDILFSSLLSFIWIGGASAATAIWYNINLCMEYIECRILQAMLAFAWLGWIFITVHLAGSICVLARSGDWDGHIYNLPQVPVVVEEESSYMEQKAGSELNAVPWSYHGGSSPKAPASFRLSSFSAFVPWLSSSDADSPRSSLTSIRRASVPRRKSRLTFELTKP